MVLFYEKSVYVKYIWHNIGRRIYAIKLHKISGYCKLLGKGKCGWPEEPI